VYYYKTHKEAFMKKSKLFLMGILGMVLVFGLTVIGCDNGTSDDGGNTGSLTITGIPATQNGKYGRASGTVGDKDILSMDGSGNQFFLISGGKVTVPLRDVTGLSGNISSLPPAFTGSGSGSITLAVANDASGTGMAAVGGPFTIPFTNGSASYEFPSDD
jgi:hypothetical protein